MNSKTHFLRGFSEGKFSLQLEKNFFLTGEGNLALRGVMVSGLKVSNIYGCMCQECGKKFNNIILYIILYY